MNEKVSVIIPTYNGEKYIQRTIDSIVLNNNQNYFELIIINDGSTDNSKKILDENKKKYTNLIVVNKDNNCGVSDSRNIGISMAKNSLIMFCDDDDEYEPHLIDNVLKEFNNKGCLELMVFGRYDVYGSNIKYCNDHHDIKEYDNLENYVINRFCTGITTFSVCNKVYRKKIIKRDNISFNKNLSLSEDLDFNLNYMKNIHIIEEYYKVNYIRYCNNYSTIYRKNNDFFDKNMALLNQFKSKYERFYGNNVFNSLYSHYIIVSLNRLFSGIDENNKTYKEFKYECEKINNYIKLNNISLKYSKNTRNIICFGLFNVKQFLLLYLIMVKIGNVIRKCRK